MRLALFTTLLVLFTACSTVHQAEVDPTTSGFYVPPKAVPGGFLVDAAFRDRYNALIGVYGKKKMEDGAPVFLPPLKKDDGLSDMGGGWWFMTKEAMENMVLLSDMKRRGSPP